MTFLEKQLVVRRSKLPAAGKGLFTRKSITKGSRIVEYKGKITTWKDVKHDEGSNGYIFYVKRYHVIDARFHSNALARYANDANGLQKVKGLRNNSEYEVEGLRVFIDAVSDIPAGGEIFVAYGKEYWEVIRYNVRLQKKAEKKFAKTTPAKST